MKFVGKKTNKSAKNSNCIFYSLFFFTKLFYFCYTPRSDISIQNRIQKLDIKGDRDGLMDKTPPNV